MVKHGLFANTRINAVLAAIGRPALLMALFVTLALHAQAKTWYVRPQAPIGSYGTENGTSYANAFNGLTIAGRTKGGLVWGGATGINAGDTVYIAGNHWLQISRPADSFFHGRIAIPVNGTSAAPITFRCDASQEPGIVWGFGRNTTLSDTWTGPDANGVYRINRDLGDFIAENVTQGAGGGVVYLNKKNTTTWFGEPGSFARVGGATYVKPANPGSPAGRLYTGDIAYRFALLRNQYITFKNCNFPGFLMDVDRDEEGELIQTQPFSHHITFEGCTLRYCSQSTQDFFRLHTGNDFWQFLNCTFEYGSNVINTIGVLGGNGASNMIIRSCNFRHIGTPLFPHQDAHGVGFRRGINNLVEHSTFEDCGSAIELWTSLGAPLKDNTIRYNFIKNVKFKQRTEGTGIVLTGENPTTGTAIPNQRTGNKFYGNIIMDCDGAGISSNCEDLVVMQNNTIVNCAVGLSLIVTGTRPVKANIKNNIIYKPRNRFVEIRGINNQLSWDYNLYYATDNVSALWQPWGSFAQWRTQNGGVDLHSVTTDPKFVSPNPVNPVDFKLIDSSPAVDGGIQVGITEDFSGQPIPKGGAPDIGAHESAVARRAGASNSGGYR